MKYEAQIKNILDTVVKLCGKGYETLLNTNMKLEQENIAKLMKMAVDYGKKSVLKVIHLLNQNQKNQ